MSVFSVAFFRKTFESVVVTFAATLSGSGIFTGGTPSLHSVYAALIASAVASLYVLAKAVGGSQTVASLGGAKHAAPTEAHNQF